MQNKGLCEAKKFNCNCRFRDCVEYTHTAHIPIYIKSGEQMAPKGKLDYLHESEFDESRQKRQWLLIYGCTGQIFALASSKSTHI